MIAKLDDLPRKRWTKDEYYKLGELGFFDGQKVELFDGEIWIQWPDAQRTGLPYPSDEPHPRLWTRDEYYRLGELEFFRGQRVELWEGEIVVLSPQNWPHASGVDRVAEVLRNTLGAGLWVRTQLPLDLGQVSEPEADVSVVPGKRTDYISHPTTALLIVEVSDSTLRDDRRTKASLYARANILDYWIVNLVDDQLEVYRDPQPDPSQPYGHRYATSLIVNRPGVISPLAASSVQIPVADLLG